MRVNLNTPLVRLSVELEPTQVVFLTKIAVDLAAEAGSQEENAFVEDDISAPPFGAEYESDEDADTPVAVPEPPPRRRRNR